ncbi:MAG TPA: CpsD/CapB family tyrosine-protein kinase [Thermoleophilaceae bacterium]|nr:CpsD/CapB family tyrosine-protein kinase [Thermoleophilaceae bacterium]
MRQHPLVVLLVLVTLPAVGVAIALTRDSDYHATTTLLLGPTAAERDTNLTERDVATARELLASPAVAARAAQTLSRSSASDVAGDVEVESKGDANALEVNASGDSGGAAARTADAYARAYAPVAGQVQPPSARPPAATILAPATATDADARPILAYGLIGLGAAVLLVLLGAPLARGLDWRIKDVAELEEIYGLPALAHIPRSRSLAKRGRSARAEAAKNTVGFSEEAEAFRTLRTNLRYFNVDAPVRSILVASPLPGDGKSTVARHLAITMASMGDSICLVNADLRKQEPGVLPTPDGLSLVLAGFDPDTALTEIPIAYDPLSEESRVLVELPSGPLPPNPAELLESDRMQWLVRQLERRFDLVIIDSPALVTVSDALTLVPRVSGVLAVGGIGQTTRQAAVDLRKQVELLGGRSLGVVANFSNQGRRYYGYYEKDQAAKASARQPSGR